MPLPDEEPARAHDAAEPDVPFGSEDEAPVAPAEPPHPADRTEEEPQDEAMAPAPDPPRGPPAAGGGPRACRAPGCPADLSTGKTYNWRYRICEDHRGASSLVVDGRRVRFCQMCAKFHDLSQFEGAPAPAAPRPHPDCDTLCMPAADRRGVITRP
jgi:hypothetical protein